MRETLLATLAVVGSAPVVRILCVNNELRFSVSATFQIFEVHDLFSTSLCVLLSSNIPSTAPVRGDAFCSCCCYPGFASALPHDAAHPQPQEADFAPIQALVLPSPADCRKPLQWWDGGVSLLLDRLPYVLRSSSCFANPGATHRQLHAFSVLQMLGMAAAPDRKQMAAEGLAKERGGTSVSRPQVFSEAEAWEAFLNRLSNGCFVSFLNCASPCEAIRCAFARAEKDSAVRGGG